MAGAQDRRRFSSGIPNDYDGYGESLRQRVFRELDKNPLLTPSTLRSVLRLDDKTNLQLLSNYKTQWRHNYRNERGLKCSSHAWRAWTYIPTLIPSRRPTSEIRSQALAVGWRLSRARNRWLLWRDRLGRLQWFETGRLNLYVRKPANLGKAYQLICNAFSFTGLITDMKVLEEVLNGLRFKSAHYVFPVGQRLPKLTIDLFQRSNGVVIKVGDETHPDSLEVLATYPDWAERNERLFEEITETLKNLTGAGPRNLSKRDDYVS